MRERERKWTPGVKAEAQIFADLVLVLHFAGRLLDGGGGEGLGEAKRQAGDEEDRKWIKISVRY